LKRSALALLAAAACATPYLPHEGHPVLVAIRFEGNDSIKSGDLLNKIVTASTSGFFDKTARYYDSDLFDIDQKRLIRFYNTRGFYEAKIADVQELHDDKGRVTLVVKIDEGKRTRVVKQDYEGLGDLSKKEIRDIDESLPIHPGDAFDEDAYDKAKQMLALRLKERGFAEATVDGSVQIRTDTAEAHITFTADPGKRYKFGKVTVSGNRRISSDEIIFSTGISKGDQYSPQAIALAQQRVYNLGTFSGVRVQLEPLSDEPVAGVRVNVREAPFQTVRFGIGGSAEQQRWELPRVHAEYANRSLFGGLRRLEVASTVGYAFVNSPFDYSPSQSGLTAENTVTLTIPNTWTPGLDVVGRAEFDREVQGGYSYDEIAGRIGVVYRLKQHTIGAGMNLVRYFNVNLQGTDLFKVVTTSGTSAAIFQDCPVSCLITYPEIRYTLDLRDNALETTSGFYGTIAVAQTVKPGSFQYFRITPDLRFFFTPVRYMTVALRTMYGALVTEGGSGSPFTQRFALGGQNDQRGFAPLQQSPKLGAAPQCTEDPFPCLQPYATQTVSIGGKTAILLTAELRFRADFILNRLGIVTFVDASRVSDDVWRNPLEHGPLEVAPGFGLRYITGFGAIRFDIAYVVNLQDQITQPIAGKDANGNPITVVLPTLISTKCKSGDRSCLQPTPYAFHVTLGEAF
jgi:outer membrane protein assembly complex protein YaeT